MVQLFRVATKMRIFRTLLIAAVNAIKEFFAFATKSSKQTEIINCSIVGNPTFEGDIVYNFTTSNYINFPYFRKRILAANYWEVVWKIKAQRVSTDQGLFGTSASYSAGIRIVSSKLSLRIKTDDSYSGNYYILDGTTTLQNDTIYFIKISFDGTYYKIFLKEENGEWNEEGSLELAQQMTFNQPWHLGWLDASPAYNYCLNYLYDSYFKFDDDIVYFYHYPVEEGDTIKLNDGMAISNYDWSAYPDRTSEKTEFTTTGTVEQIKEVDGEMIYVTQEPEQDNKTVKVATGTTYYAYTHDNNSVYATDNPIRSEIFNLQNASVIGTLTENQGVYSGFNFYDYLYYHQTFEGTVTSIEYLFDVNTGSSFNASGRILNGVADNDQYVIGMIADTIWWHLGSDTAKIIISGTFSTNTRYLIKFKYENGVYSGQYSTDNGSTWSTPVTNTAEAPVFNDYNFSIGCRSYDHNAVCIWYGSINMATSYIKINNTTTNFGTLTTASTLYDNTLTALSPQPTFTAQNEGLVNITNNSCTDLGNGIYQGGSGKYLVTDYTPNLTSASSWELELVYTYKGGGTYPTLLACSDGSPANPLFIAGGYEGRELGVYLSTDGTSSGNIAADYKFLTQEINTKYWIKLHYDNSNGYWIKVSTTGEYSDIKVWSNATATAVSCTKPMYFLNNGYNLSSYCNNSELDLKVSSLTIDGVKMFFYNTVSGITINNNLYIKNNEGNIFQGLDSNISLVDNTIINEVTVSTPTIGYKDVPYYAYTHSNESIYTKDNPIIDGTWKNPLLTEDGTMGGSNPACIASHQSQPAWWAFDGDTTTGDRCWWTYHGITSISNPCWITYYTPTTIKLNYVEIFNEVATPESPKTGIIQGSNDNSTWTNLANINVASNTAGLKTTIEVNAVNTYKYFRFYFTESWGSGGVSIQEIKLFGETDPSTLYENTGINEFTPLDPQPEFTINNAGLINSTVVGTLTDTNGVYSGFDQSKYIQLNTTTPTTSLDFVVKCKPTSSYGDLLRSQPDGAGILLRCTSSTVSCYLSSSGSGWNTLSNFNTGITMTANTDIYIKISWNSTTGIYTFYQSMDGIVWTTKNSSEGSKAAPYFNNTQTIGGCSSYSEHWYGTVDLSKTKMIIDGVEIKFCNSNGGITINNILYERNTEDDSYERLLVPATIETSANLTTSNNDNLLAGHHVFKMTKPVNTTLTVQAGGINYNETSILLKENLGVTATLKIDNVLHYLNSWLITHGCDLHYQEIQFNTNVTDPLIMYAINGLYFNIAPYYGYVKDKIDYKVSKENYCDFTGSFTLGYTEKDGKIITVETPLTPMTGIVDTDDYTYTINNTGDMILTSYTGTSSDTVVPNITIQ